MLPDTVIRAIWLFVPESLNHRLPSDPAAIPSGDTEGATGNTVSVPDVVIRSITLVKVVAQRLPSGPEVISSSP